MATVNAVGNTLTGTTGTGNFVGANTPTLITPVLGVSTATSINFGGGAYSQYVPKTSFTPIFTFATPGDLSVVYTIQSGTYAIDGDVLSFYYSITFTPTFGGTASGEIRLTGLPIAASSSVDAYLTNAIHGGGVTYGAGNTQINGLVSSGNTYATIITTGSAAALTTLSTTSIVSGVSIGFRLEGFYLL
jgi:hypothetical protein